MTDDVEVLNKVLEKESGGKDYVVETTEGEITYEVHRVSRTRRFEFIESLPDAIVDAMREQAGEQREKIDVDEISSLDDISKAEPDDDAIPDDTAMTKEAVEEMEDFIVEAFDHPKITDRETRDLLELWPDEQFFATSFLILAISSETEGVRGFRID